MQEAEAAKQKADSTVAAAGQEAETLQSQLAAAAAELLQQKKAAAERAHALAVELGSVRQEAAAEAAESSRLRAALAELRGLLQVPLLDSVPVIYFG